MYTKLKTIFTILFMAMVVMSSAQKSRFNLSINTLTTNFNYGKLNSSLKDYKKDYRGLQLGFSYQAGISKSFSLVPELYFAIKGGTLKSDNPHTISKSTVRLNTIDMPVLARMHFNQFYVNAGPYIGYTLSGRMKVLGNDSVIATSAKISFGKAVNDFNRWDYGWQAGAGYNFNVKKSVLTLDVRYGYGLANVSHDLNRYNRMLNISLLLSRK